MSGRRKRVKVPRRSSDAAGSRAARRGRRLRRQRARRRGGARRGGRARPRDRGAPAAGVDVGGTAARRRGAGRRAPARAPRRRTLVVTSPGVPAGRAGAAMGARAGHPGVERDRARRAPVHGPVPGGDRNERQDHDRRDARRDDARRRAGRPGRAATSATRSRSRRASRGTCSRWRRRRSSCGTTRALPPAGVGAAEPGARPPRLARVDRGIRGGEGRASSNAAAARRPRRQRRRLRPRPRSRGGPCEVRWFRGGAAGARRGRASRTTSVVVRGDGRGRAPRRLGVPPAARACVRTPRPPRRPRSRSASTPARGRRRASSSFEPLPHRGEVVAEIGRRHGSSTTRRPRTRTPRWRRSRAARRRADRRRARQGRRPVAARGGGRRSLTASSRSARPTARSAACSTASCPSRRPRRSRRRCALAFAMAAGGGDVVLAPGVREPGHVPRLPRARRPLRRRRARAGDGAGAHDPDRGDADA